MMELARGRCGAAASVEEAPVVKLQTSAVQMEGTSRLYRGLAFGLPAAPKPAKLAAQSHAQAHVATAAALNIEEADYAEGRDSSADATSRSCRAELGHN